MTVRAHADAVLSLLRAVSGLTVYDGQVPSQPALPYVVVYFDAGPPNQELASLDDLSSERDWSFQVTSVGGTREQAQWAVEGAFAGLYGVRPSVAGRSCGRIRHVGSQPARRDDDVTPPLMYATDQWRFLSTPA